jgi:hypothetical protein
MASRKSELLEDFKVASITDNQPSYVQSVFSQGPVCGGARGEDLLVANDIAGYASMKMGIRKTMMRQHEVISAKEISRLTGLSLTSSEDLLPSLDRILAAVDIE